MDNRKTTLFDFHVAAGARMVPFAGWDMPVQYPSGIKAEHIATRTTCGLFDVSHMAQISFEASEDGSAVETMLAKLTPTDLGLIGEGRVRYSMFLDDNGGVLDDLMIARLDGLLQLVANAGRADHDIAHLKAHLGENISMTVHDELSLIALQGPKAASVLQDLGIALDVDMADFNFMDIRHATLMGTKVTLTRSGYTGEDGFEISIPNEAIIDITTALAAHNDVHLAGLGARDTLRMEAGLPLWGHELSETINPVEAGLGFAVSKRRREAGDFPGAKHILADLNNGAGRRLVGLLPEGKRPVRDGTILKHGDAEDEIEIGFVSSGGFAPSLDAPAAIGFVSTEFAHSGTRLMADTRGKPTPIIVADLPLVPHRFYRG
ncbi:glycine cleavage system aminomethyltransferase GcvT [Candidatus Puniceispirillum sp.]|uniref:glycine cleavage system aminomethyltransferase GcvT n=1 Tax=Candidatus Puniceispirillum sp. TaxID=2026719 RepID=UPI002FCE11C1